jgi:hypothetical protein
LAETLTSSNQLSCSSLAYELGNAEWIWLIGDHFLGSLSVVNMTWRLEALKLFSEGYSEELVFPASHFWDFDPSSLECLDLSDIDQSSRMGGCTSQTRTGCLISLPGWDSPTTGCSILTRTLHLWLSVSSMSHVRTFVAFFFS